MKFNAISSTTTALANELSRMFNKGIGADNLTKEIVLKLEQPGQISYFPRSTPPDGWLEANGALLLRSAYPDLWAEAQASGNLVSEAEWAAGRFGSYSTGDGSTTFRIPDLRDYFIRGLATGRTLGSYQEDAFQGHWHNSVAVTGTVGTECDTPSSYFSSATSARIGATNPRTDGTNGTPRTASETRPKNIALLVCIFAGRRIT